MKKGLNVKDLINVGLFSVLSILFTFVGGMIGFIPFLMPIVPLVAGILVGPVNMLFATKIKKVGMIAIQQTVMGLLFFATGHGIWSLLFAPIGIVIAEYIMKKGNYTSINHARWAFSFTTVSFVGNWIPVFFAREKYIKQLIDMGYGAEYAQKMMSVMPSWFFVPLILIGFIGMYIGCTIGIKILKKHFVKAGMIKDV